MTSNLEKRLNYHNSGKVKSTKHRKPLMLIHKENFSTRSEAFKRERELKLPSAAKLKSKLAIH